MSLRRGKRRQPPTARREGIGSVLNAIAAQFRSDVQGLRAIAVVMVIVYHLHPAALPGGFVGVDVFFVISGYLVTGGLARSQRRRGRVRLLEFWGRRARRLLPAAALVLTVTWLASRVLLPVTRLPAAAEQVRASALYVQNWVLARDAVDYLTAADAPSPVQHFWSLSVEEQFYLVWPLLFVVAALAGMQGRARTGRYVLGALAGGLVASSLAYSAHLTATDPAAYFVTTTRIWELGAGGLLALAPEPLRALVARQGWLAWFGLVLVIGSGFVLNAGAAFPGTAALLPVGGALLLLASGGWDARRGTWWLTARRPLVFLGDISYSLYLWHWPLIVLWTGSTGRSLGYRSALVIAAAAVLLAWATTTFVEDPVRRARVIALHPGRSLATALTVLVPTLLAASYTAPVRRPPKLDATHLGAALVTRPAAHSAGRPRARPSPTLPVGVDLTPAEKFAIDPHPFLDADGSWYLYYARDVLDGERVGTHLAVDRLLSKTATAGSPRSVLVPTGD